MGVTSIRLNPEIEAPLKRLAGKIDRSRNYIINQAIKAYLEQEALEEVRWQETLVALESVEAGRVIDGDKVKEWLESWGTDDEKEPPQI